MVAGDEPEKNQESPTFQGEIRSAARILDSILEKHDSDYAEFLDLFLKVISRRPTPVSKKALVNDIKANLKTLRAL